MDTPLSYILDVQDEVPDFNLESQVGGIHFHDLIDGKWCLLVTVHKIFDPVNTTEIGALQKLLSEFNARNVAVLLLGNDSVSNYRKWISEISELESVPIEIPLMSDPTGAVLKQFGCAREVHPSNELRIISCGTFLINIDRRIMSSVRNSVNIGRNFYESIRLFDACQLTTSFRVVCPANWVHIAAFLSVKICIV